MSFFKVFSVLRRSSSWSSSVKSVKGKEKVKVSARSKLVELCDPVQQSGVVINLFIKLCQQLDNVHLCSCKYQRHDVNI